MKRPLTIVILALLVVGGFGGLHWLRSVKTQRDSETTLQGRTTSEWLHQVEISGAPEPNPALEVLASTGPKLIPELSEILLARESLKDLSLRLPSAIVSLDKKYSDADTSAVLRLKSRAAYVLGVIAHRNPSSPEVQEAIPPLMAGLRSGSPTVRWLSAQGLGAIGASASNAIPALAACMSEDDVGLRMSAVEAIGRIGNSSPLGNKALARALSDTNADVRLTAPQALAALRQFEPPASSDR